jgi:hypothetical protein
VPHDRNQVGRRAVEVEFKGNPFTAFVSREAIEDLGELRGIEPERVWLEVTEKNLGNISEPLTVGAA